MLVLKYFWQVIKRFKISFFSVVFFTIIASILDVYIPLKYLNLWNVLSANNFSFIYSAKLIIILILILNLVRWIFRRIGGFSNAYFQAEVMAGLRAQAFSYMIGQSHSFFSNNFGGSLTRKINKYANAFEKITDRMVSDGLPLVVRGIGTVIAIYTLLPKYALILGIFCIIFLITAFFITRYKLKYEIIAAESDTKTTGALSDSISNHSSIQLFTGHEYEKERVGNVIEEQRHSVLFNWYLWEVLNSVEGLYAVAIEFIIFWFAIGDWKLGLIGLPVMVLLQTYLIRLMENLWNFTGIIRAFYEAFADAQEMAIIIDTPNTVADNL